MFNQFKRVDRGREAGRLRATNAKVTSRLFAVVHRCLFPRSYLPTKTWVGFIRGGTTVGAHTWLRVAKISTKGLVLVATRD